MVSTDGAASWRTICSPLSNLDDDGLNHAGAQLGAGGDTTLLAVSRMSVSHYGTTEWTSYEGGIRDADTVIVRADGNHWDQVQIHDWRRHPDEWAIPCGPPVWLGGQAWLLPMERHHRGDRVGWLQKYHAFVIFSQDDGRSWGDPTPILNSEDGRKAYYDQRIVPVDQNSRLLSVAWVHDVIDDRTVNAQAAHSTDAGRNWTEPRDTGLLGGPVNGVCLSDGRVLAAYNRRTPPAGIFLAISEDSGLTWQTDRQVVAWDEAQRRVTGQIINTDANIQTTDPLWDTMWGWTFGSPTPVRAPDGSVYITFHAAGFDGIRAARWLRVELD
jgi:hypothetical protein